MPTSVDNLAAGIDPTLSLVTTTINDTVGVGGGLERATWSLGVDQTVPEGSPASYLLSLSRQSASRRSSSVELALTDIDTNSSDYGSFSAAITSAIAGYSGPGTFAWDGTSLEFTSDGSGPMSGLSISFDTANDAIAEGTEDFLISLSNANSTTGVATAIDVAGDDAITTIDDLAGSGSDDVTWSLTGDTSVDEGGVASYLIELDGALGAGEVASVEFDIADLERVALTMRISARRLRMQLLLTPVQEL